MISNVWMGRRCVFFLSSVWRRSREGEGLFDTRLWDLGVRALIWDIDGWEVWETPVYPGGGMRRPGSRVGGPGSCVGRCGVAV